MSNRAGRSQRENHLTVHQRRKNHCTDFESGPDKAAGRDGQEEKAAGEREGQCKRTGKQSIKSLQKSGAQITNIVVTDNNIKSFDRVARKYGIDYSLKKVEQEGKSEYLVFFKAKDVDVMTAAFKEYTSETLKKQKRESVRQKLEKVKEELSNHRQLKKEKKREQEPIR